MGRTRKTARGGGAGRGGKIELQIFKKNMFGFDGPQWIPSNYNIKIDEGTTIYNLITILSRDLPRILPGISGYDILLKKKSGDEWDLMNGVKSMYVMKDGDRRLFITSSEDIPVRDDLKRAYDLKRGAKNTQITERMVRAPAAPAAPAPAELINAQKRLREAQDQIAKLEANNLDPIIPQIPEKPGKISVHLIDPELLKIIPFEDIEKINEFYYVTNEVVDDAKNVGPINPNKRGNANFNGLEYADVVETTIIAQENIRRRSYARKLAKINAKPDNERTVTEKYILSVDAEVQAEYLDQAKRNAYPPHKQITDIITLEDGEGYKLHYHTNDEEPDRNYTSIEGLFGHIKNELNTDEFTTIIPCYRSVNPPNDIGCKRNLTVYQIWRTLKSGDKPDLYKEHLIEILNKLTPRILYPINKHIESRIKERASDIRNELTASQEALAALKILQQAQGVERQRLANIEREFNRQTELYNNYIFSKKRLDEYRRGGFDKNLDTNPVTHGIFCPYCAGYISDRENVAGDAVKCKYLYQGMLAEANHQHVGQYNRIRVPDINGNSTDLCTVCWGPCAYHDHVILDTGAHPNYPPDGGQDLCMGNNRREEGRPLDNSCRREGGGGVLESIIRLLAYRDYAKEKIRENPRGFQLRFDEMARKANEYAIILRGSLNIQGRERRRNDPNNIIGRAKTAWRNDRWEGGLEIISRVDKPIRANIEAMYPAGRVGGPRTAANNNAGRALANNNAAALAAVEEAEIANAIAAAEAAGVADAADAAEVAEAADAAEAAVPLPYNYGFPAARAPNPRPYNYGFPAARAPAPLYNYGLPAAAMARPLPDFPDPAAHYGPQRRRRAGSVGGSRKKTRKTFKRWHKRPSQKFSRHKKNSARHPKSQAKN